MIEVPQEAKLQTIKTAADLHSELLGYYGRILRVQTAETDYRPGDIYAYDDRHDYYHHQDLASEQITLSDSLGRLVAIQLNECSNWYDEGEVPQHFTGSLTVSLEAIESIKLNLDRTQLMMLQEDTGNWVVIFRGENWKEYQR